MARFMANLANKHSEGINKTESKYGHDDKKRERCRINAAVTLMLNI